MLNFLLVECLHLGSSMSYMSPFESMIVVALGIDRIRMRTLGGVEAPSLASSHLALWDLLESGILWLGRGLIIYLRDCDLGVCALVDRRAFPREVTPRKTLCFERKDHQVTTLIQRTLGGVDLLAIHLEAESELMM